MFFIWFSTFRMFFLRFWAIEEEKRVFYFDGVVVFLLFVIVLGFVFYFLGVVLGIY